MTASAISRMRCSCRGRSLPDSAWRARHHAMVGVLFAERSGWCCSAGPGQQLAAQHRARRRAHPDRRDRAADRGPSPGGVGARLARADHRMRAARAHLARRSRPTSSSSSRSWCSRSTRTGCHSSWPPPTWFSTTARWVRSTPTASTTTRTPSTIPGSGRSFTAASSSPAASRRPRGLAAQRGRPRRGQRERGALQGRLRGRPDRDDPVQLQRVHWRREPGQRGDVPDHRSHA